MAKGRNICVRRGGCGNLITFNRQRLGTSSGNTYTWLDYSESGVTSGLYFNLSKTPYFIYGIFKNGIRLTNGIDFTFTGTLITFIEALDNDLITVIYTPQVMQLKEDSNTVVGGTTYVLSQTPIFIYGVYKNGIRLTEPGDYSIVGNTITFVDTLDNDLITVAYKY